MAKKKELATTNTDLTVPEYLADEAGVGLEDTARLITPPRMRIVQAQSRAPLSDLFNVGDTVIVPQNELVAPLPYDGGRPAEQGEDFLITPLFFYVEFLVWNDIKLQATEESVLNRTTDPEDEIALKARNPKLWKEAHPNGKADYFIRYSEHLNFIVTIENENSDVRGLPIVMSFNGAEHRTGANFLALLKMRRAPLYGCTFNVATGRRENSKGNWYGWDITNPKDGSPRWVPANKIDAYRELYHEMKEAFESNMLATEYDVEENTSSAPKDAGEF